MPYLRFFRDERGYEHTYLLHGLRTGSRPRLLYWFRTPPNVSIGRLPLDEDAIRAIEDANGDLTFDWARMLRVKPKPAPVRTEETGGRRARSRGGARRKPRAESVVLPAAVEPLEASAAESLEASGAESLEASAAEEQGVADVGERQEAAVERVQGHPVAALVGDDGLARLRAQYAELRARVAESRAEPRLREQVAVRVEALNPDRWRAGEEAVVGIERFEAAVAAIKTDLGRRPRRSSRGRRGKEKAPVAEQAGKAGEAVSD